MSACFCLYKLRYSFPSNPAGVAVQSVKWYQYMAVHWQLSDRQRIQTFSAVPLGQLRNLWSFKANLVQFFFVCLFLSSACLCVWMTVRSDPAHRTAIHTDRPTHSVTCGWLSALTLHTGQPSTQTDQHTVSHVDDCPLWPCTPDSHPHRQTNTQCHMWMTARSDPAYRTAIHTDWQIPSVTYIQLFPLLMAAHSCQTL